MAVPVRLQLSRRRGFNLQALSRETNGLEAVVVTRRSARWGNPFSIDSAIQFHAGFGQPANGETPRQSAIRWFQEWLEGDYELRPYCEKPPSKDDIVTALRGKNLACTCPPMQPCHADVLLAIANTPDTRSLDEAARR